MSIPIILLSAVVVGLLVLINIIGVIIMSKISEFAAAQAEANAKINAAVTGLQGDVQSLNDKITELQNSAGTITPEDQALLDSLQADAVTIADKLAALDALTPASTPPVEPPTP